MFDQKRDHNIEGFGIGLAADLIGKFMQPRDVRRGRGENIQKLVIQRQRTGTNDLERESRAACRKLDQTLQLLAG